MRIADFIASGIVLGVAWPFAAMMTGFAHDQEKVSAAVGFVRSSMGLTLFAIPVVWVVSVIAALIIHFRMKVPSRPAAGDTDADLVREAAARKAGKSRKEQLLNRCAVAPFVAAALHLATWGLLAVVGR